VPPRVAIFILNYNGLRLLGSSLYRSVESALRVDYQESDVVVIDNASTDGSFEAVKDRFGNDVRLISLGHNFGYAGGNELGFRKYSAVIGRPDYAIFMNNDFVVTNEGFVKEAIKFMRVRDDVALCQGYHLSYDGIHVDNAGCFLDIFMNPIHRCNGLSLSECPALRSYVTYVNGSCFAVNIKTTLKFRNIIFNPRLFAYWDETELALSLWSHGVKSVFIPKVTGVHLGSKSFGKFSPLHTYLVERNKHIVRRRYLVKPLNVLSTPSLLRFIFTLPIRPLHGIKGKMITKAFVDSYLGNVPDDATLGPFIPLIIVPKKFDDFVAHLLPSNSGRFKIAIDKSATLRVTDDHLKAISRPFTILADF